MSVIYAMTFVSGGLRQAFPMLRLLRLRPFDVSTPQGRADERHRRGVLTTLAMALAKLLSIATALISVPLALHYLGPERYGMWMAMSSLIAMLNFADFGIGNGILNAVSAAYGKDQPSAIKEFVSSGFLVLTAIAVAIVALFAACYAFVPWFKLFNVTSQVAREEAAPALAVFVCCFALAIPLSIVQRLQIGLQRGFSASLWQCAGSLVGLAGVLAAIALQLSLPILTLAFVGGPLVASVLNNVVFFGWLERQMAPRLQFVSLRAIGHIAHIGFWFFMLQAVTAVTFYSDNIVIAQMLGAAAVATYAVSQRLFSIVGLVVGMALSPLWPAYGEAIARGDHAWVRITLKRSLIAAVGLSALGALGLIAFGNWFIHMWVGQSVTASLLLLLGLGLLQVVQSAGGATVAYLNGANFIRFQVIVGILTAATAIVLKILLVPIIGNSGVVWGTILSYLFLTLVPSYFFLYKRLNA
jgi:O-antigen/teichoic acid export membrane protein